ncbi:MAG: [FeFe] hydrogenase H-cluster maturation GTPase HydF [Desulfosporosinus sp.]|jgi:small GTP-binding protein
MGLNEAPRGVRVHLALFGRRNAGKSSVINALTGQETAIVSEVQGTTTDPVFKAMEILPIGPCVIIDTAGIDDVGELGEARKKKTLEVLDLADVALIIIDINVGLTEDERLFINKVKSKKKPLLVVLNKIDTFANNTFENNMIKNNTPEKTINKNKNENANENTKKKINKNINNQNQNQNKNNNYEIIVSSLQKDLNIPVVAVSALKKHGINKLMDAIISVIPAEENKDKIVGDLIKRGDFVVLVTPLDNAAPRGRLILPQQQTIREILESDAVAIVTKEYELGETLSNLVKKPKLVITDSQVFAQVASATPQDILLTSFSILFARQKGDLAEFIKGAKAIETLKDGDIVLIAEGCTHHRQSDDLGSVKIPRWIRQRTGKQIGFAFSSGASFTEDIKQYALIVHCGACMLNRSAMRSRIERAKDYQVPIVNYGILIAYMQGILPRALAPFSPAGVILEED